MIDYLIPLVGDLSVQTLEGLNPQPLLQQVTTAFAITILALFVEQWKKQRQTPGWTLSLSLATILGFIGCVAAAGMQLWNGDFSDGIVLTFTTMAISPFLKKAYTTLAAPPAAGWKKELWIFSRNLMFLSACGVLGLRYESKIFNLVAVLVNYLKEAHEEEPNKRRVILFFNWAVVAASIALLIINADGDPYQAIGHAAVFVLFLIGASGDTVMLMKEEFESIGGLPPFVNSDTHA